jgi:hypothetical protein
VICDLLGQHEVLSGADLESSSMENVSVEQSVTSTSKSVPFLKSTSKGWRGAAKILTDNVVKKSEPKSLRQFLELVCTKKFPWADPELMAEQSLQLWEMMNSQCTVRGYTRAGPGNT